MANPKIHLHRSTSCTGYSCEGGKLHITTLRACARPEVTGELCLSAIRDDIIKVRFFEGEKNTGPLPPHPDTVINTEATGTFHVEETDQELIVETSVLKIIVNKRTCSMTYFDRQGRLLCREAADGGKYLTPIDIEHEVLVEGRKQVEEDSVDGMRTRLEGSAKEKVRDGFRAQLALELQDDEAVYGLGQHEEGILNYRKQQQFLYQQNMKVAMPVMVSTKGYGLFWDTLALSTFNDGPDELTRITIDATDALTYYFIAGPEFDAIVAGLRYLSGQVPMLPKWAYGYLQSKERYETAQELCEVVKEYRRRSVPLDCIILDWRSWTGDQWGQKSLDPERFPDPHAMNEELHRHDARLMVSIWPVMKNNDNRREFAQHDLLLGNGATYDAYSGEGRALYWKQTNEGLFSKGVDAWWCDCTEPFEADWKGPHKQDPFFRMQVNTTESKKYLDPMFINGYSLAHSQGLYEGQRSTGSQKRVVNLTRSGAVGQHRYNTITWSGDIEARWSRMRRQIADGLNFTITGSPRWTLDIGAFFVKPAPPWFWDGVYPKGVSDLGYRELYLRWLQMAVFLPIFRSHGTDTPREIWRFGEPGEACYEAIKKSIELRYQLLPYLYSLAGWECHRSYTTFRNLAFDYREDTTVHNIADQFMCGPSLMVCPVLEPQEYDAESTPIHDATCSRKVYLPAGHCWYDFHTSRKFEGGQWIKVDCQLDRIPVFVPAGSIIPMGPVIQHTGEKSGDPWVLRVYPGRDGSFDLYDDAGDGYGYEDSELSWRSLVWDDASGTLKVGDAKGSFPGMVDREFQIEIISPCH